LADFVAPSSVEKVKQYFRESIVTPYEIEVLKKDGSTFPALVQGRFIELGGKQIRISTALDLSEIKQRDKLLFQQSKMASMGEMIGNIAHQWRQPLSVISTIATGLKFQIEFDTFDKKEAMGDLDSLNNTVQYLSKTIDDFRNFFKSNKFKTEFNLSEAIQKDVNLLSATLKNNFIRLGLDLDNSLEISGYRSELTQAILNILNNAKDALIENDVNEDDRVVLIRTYKKQNTAVIEIADSGGGINEQIADKIFEPYFTTKHQSQGTGIGLYMTYEIIVKSFGGHIGVKNKDFIYENKPYFGAIFRILLPMSENHNA
jgi:signal transduction histidine kinase